MTKSQACKFIDHTLLKPEAINSDITRLCNEAKDYGFYSVCVNPCFIKLAKDNLKNTPVKVCSVISFPLGASSTNTKVFEARECVKNGANEIDMVANISAIKNKDYAYLENDIRMVKNAIGDDIFLKVIIETCLLSDSEKEIISKIVRQSGANCVKTSTGFSKSGANVHDIKLIRSCVGNDFDIKASGGIRDLKTFEDLINAGATRIGASASCSIIDSI